MELPYYMTPLVGALAWAVIAGPKSGFVNQLWKRVGRQRRPGRHLHPFRHRLGHGAVRGHGRLRHDRGLDEVDGSRARGIGAGDGRLQAAHHAHRHPAAGHAGRAGRHAVRLRRDAGLVRRRPGDRHSRPHLRHHHRDLGFDAVLSAGLRPRLGDGAGAVRRHVRHADLLSLGDRPRQLRHHHRQGLPAAADGHGPPGLAAVRRLPALHPAGRRAADRGADLHLAAALRHRDPEPGRVHARQLPDRAVAGAGAHRAGQQPDAGLRRGDRRRAGDGAPGLDHLPLAARRPRRRSNIS